MTINIEIVWWMLPAAVFIDNTIWFLWPRPDEWKNDGAYSWPLGMFMLPVRAGVAAITTLAAVIMWRW